MYLENKKYISLVFFYYMNEVEEEAELTLYILR